MKRHCVSLHTITTFSYHVLTIESQKYYIKNKIIDIGSVNTMFLNENPIRENIG